MQRCIWDGLRIHPLTFTARCTPPSEHECKCLATKGEPLATLVFFFPPPGNLPLGCVEEQFIAAFLYQHLGHGFSGLNVYSLGLIRERLGWTSSYRSLLLD